MGGGGGDEAKSTDCSSSITQTTLHPLKTVLQENNNAGTPEKGGRSEREGGREKRFLGNVIKEHTKMLVVEASSARLDYW